jgi:hypothetical protein
MFKTMILAGFATIALAGCAQPQPQAVNYSAPVTSADYCASQGSAQANEMCRQYYARHPELSPPQPVYSQSSTADPAVIQARAAALMPPPVAFPVAPHFNCTSNGVGQFVYTNCN